MIGHFLRILFIEQQLTVIFGNVFGMFPFFLRDAALFAAGIVCNYCVCHCRAP